MSNNGSYLTVKIVDDEFIMHGEGVLSCEELMCMAAILVDGVVEMMQSMAEAEGVKEDRNELLTDLLDYIREILINYEATDTEILIRRVKEGFKI